MRSVAVGSIVAGLGLLVSACGGQDAADVHVDLTSFAVSPDVPSVKAGKVKFTAVNRDEDEVHELAVMRVNGPNDFTNLGEIEDLDPLAEGSLTLDLERGDYLLACLLAAGEAGSKVDHFQQGMKIPFEVD